MTLNAKYDNYFKRTLNSEKCFKFSKMARNEKTEKGGFSTQNHKMCAFWGTKMGIFRKKLEMPHVFFVVGCMSYVVSCSVFGNSIYRFIFNIFSCIFLIKDH